MYSCVESHICDIFPLNFKVSLWYQPLCFLFSTFFMPCAIAFNLCFLLKFLKDLFKVTFLILDILYPSVWNKEPVITCNSCTVKKKLIIEFIFWRWSGMRIFYWINIFSETEKCTYLSRHKNFPFLIGIPNFFVKNSAFPFFFFFFLPDFFFFFFSQVALFFSESHSRVC